MKKFLSLILALVLVLALAVPALAEDDVEPAATTYTITMKTRNGHTYTAYQIFAGDLVEVTEGEGESATTKTVLSNITWGTGVDGEAFLAALKTSELFDYEDGNPFENLSTAREVAELLGTYVNDAVFLFKFASVAEQYKTTGKTSTVKDGAIVIEELAAGYYLILDSTANIPEGESKSDYILEVVGDIEVDAKDITVVSDKQIKDINDSTSTEAAIDATDTADWDIGDDVPFILTAKVSDDLVYYDTFTLVFHDKLSEGLTLNVDSIKVYLDNDVNDHYDMGNSGTYTIVTEGLEDGCSFEVRFADLRSYPFKSGDMLTVEYTAKLNSNAVIGNPGNPNESYVSYSNDPNSDQMGKTPTDKVTVFTFKLEINKTDEETTYPLGGAMFALYKFDKEANDWVEFAAPRVYGQDNSAFDFVGLDDGRYKLVETTTPPGYNTMEDFEFTVEASHAEVNGVAQITELVVKDKDGNVITDDVEGGMFTVVLDKGIIATDITNKPGSVLPSTGGIGTTIFYIVGAILVIGAGVLLVAKRRVNE